MSIDVDRPAAHDGWHLSELHSASAQEDIERTRGILSSANRILGVGAPSLRFADADAKGAVRALSAARQALNNYIDEAAVPSGKAPLQHIAALLLRAELAQASLLDGVLVGNAGKVVGASEAVQRLRGADSVTSLAERAPCEAHRMGLSRILFSRIENGTWLAHSAYAGDDEQFARTMVEVGIANPRRLTGALVESEMVRRGIPIYVPNPQSNPRVHTELVNFTDTQAYVAAPVFAWGKPIGLIHADRRRELGMVNEFERDLLAAFAEGLGVTFERNVLLERLRAVQSAAADHLRGVNDLADDFTSEVVDMAGLRMNSDRLLRDGSPAERRHHDDLVGELTRREREVLRSLALGKTNAQIAVSLFVTEGTVKSHVKSILRKLGAANRTDAVARYHRMTDSLRVG